MKSQEPFVKDATDWELLQMKLEPSAGDMYYTGSVTVHTRAIRKVALRLVGAQNAHHHVPLLRSYQRGV